MLSIDDLKFNGHGLIPAIVVDAVSGKVLTLAYMNRESLQISMDEGRTCFWSRSRKELWRKGEESGNVQHIRSIVADCDRDALVVTVDKEGPACHLGTDSCFNDPVYLKEAAEPFSVKGLYVLLEGRKQDKPEGSKRFSACGARIGALISRNQELMGHALKFCQARLSVATLDQVAAAALYTVPSNYFDATREEYKRRRDTVVAKLSEIPGVVCKCPEGAFYLMAKLPVDNADDFQMFLLREFDDNGETVMYAPGEPFYATPGRGVDEIRIAYVINEADLSRAIELLGKGIAAYNAKKQ